MAGQGVDYAEGEWLSEDGLTLRYRDYTGLAPAAPARPVILCLPGLTRNARDYANLAERLAGPWRIICPDFRGRGQSDYAKDPGTYMPDQYADDLLVLLDGLGIEKVIVIGTALGGIVAMNLAGRVPHRLAGALLNDVGPEITPTGLARIRDYVGLGRSYPTWMHAARSLRENGQAANPDYGLDDWLVLAKQIMRVGSNNRIVFDYDMQIAEPFKQLPLNGEAAKPMWQGFERLAEKPLLIVRGDLSDILSAETLARMITRAPNARSVTVARTGHAPSLDEPDAQAAMAEWLHDLAAAPPYTAAFQP